MSSLKELQALGAFVSDKPVKKEITFKLDGDEEHTAVIHVKKLSVGDYESLFLTEKEERSRTATLIAQAVSLGPDGKERISFEQAYKLHAGLAGAMVNAFNEVNLAKKSSRPETGSSAT